MAISDILSVEKQSQSFDKLRSARAHGQEQDRFLTAEDRKQKEKIEHARFRQNTYVTSLIGINPASYSFAAMNSPDFFQENDKTYLDLSADM